MNSIRDRVQKLEAITPTANLFDLCGLTEAQVPEFVENAIKDLEWQGEPVTPEAAALLADLKSYLDEERSRYATTG